MRSQVVLEKARLSSKLRPEECFFSQTRDRGKSVRLFAKRENLIRGQEDEGDPLIEDDDSGEDSDDKHDAADDFSEHNGALKGDTSLDEGSQKDQNGVTSGYFP